MVMKTHRSKKLPEVIVTVPEVFYDFRGKYVETYNKKEYSTLIDFNGEPLDFVQDDISISRKHVLRGLHGDHKTWKLIQCLSGAIFVAVVDMRPSSPNYLKFDTFSDRKSVV